MVDPTALIELERRARAGEAWAFGQVVRHHERDLRGLVWSVVRNGEHTDDVLQSAFEKAFRRIKTFQGDAPMKSWLQSICYRAALDHLRYEGRRRHLDLDALASVASSDDVAHRVETLDHFDAVMASLDPETRALLMLTAGHGHTLTEAARITGLPVGTVNSRLSRARRRLQMEAS
ncbi:MAG: RNA polymerase sigma factor [Actinomycetota bacterium]